MQFYGDITYYLSNSTLIAYAIFLPDTDNDFNFPLKDFNSGYWKITEINISVF